MTPAACSLRQRHAAKPLEAGAATAAAAAAHLDAAAIPPTGGANRTARANALFPVNAALDHAGRAIGANANPEFLGRSRGSSEAGPKGHEGGKSSRFQSVTHVLSRLHYSKLCPADNARLPGVFRCGALRCWRWRMI